MSDSEDSQSPSKKTTPKKGKKNAPKNVEEEFQKVNPREHVLLRPDTYVGSVQQHTEVITLIAFFGVVLSSTHKRIFCFSQEMWVYDSEQKKMIHREIKYVPGLYKIFDEIIVNASDNKQRDPSMSCIKVTINP